MSTDFPDWYQAELNSNADDTSVRQTIAKPHVVHETCRDFLVVPNRLQRRAVKLHPLVVSILPHREDRRRIEDGRELARPGDRL